MRVQMGQEQGKSIVPDYLDVFAAKYLALVFRLLKLGFATKDEVLAAHDPVVGQPASPIEDHVPVFVLPARVLAKVNNVFLASFAFRGD